MSLHFRIPGTPGISGVDDIRQPIRIPHLPYFTAPINFTDMRTIAYCFLLVVASQLLSTSLWGQSFVVRPFLQDAEPNSIRVVWEAGGTEDCTLEWGADEALGTSINSAGTSSNGGAMHDVLIEGLMPDTPYFYAVTSGSETTDAARFRTPPTSDSEADFSFVAMSDMQRSNSNPGIFDEVVHQGVLDYFGGVTSDEIALVLIPGDLVDNGSIYDEWANDFFTPSHDLFSQVPVYPVLGNHEVNSSYYFQYFHLPENGTAGYEEHWWFKDYGNVRFMGLNSNGPYDGAEQLAWLDGTLDATCGLEDIDFVFAQLHHPHKSELWTPGESDFTGDVVARLEAFTEDCGKPSVHFFGHTHGYSRGQSLDHKHLWINVATAGGAIDYWGEWPHFDYDEFEITTDDWGFVAVDVVAGPEPQFTVKRLSRGDNNVDLDNAVTDSLVITKADVPVQPPLAVAPVGETLPPECVVLAAEPFAGGSAEAQHGASQWQVSDDINGFSAPIADVWERYRNIYFDEDTQAGEVLVTEAMPGLPENSDLWWRVRYRDRNLNWSDWTAPVPFTTSESLLGDNLLVNPGAEDGLDGWTVTEGIAESLTAGECNGVNPYEGQRYFAVGGLCTESDLARMHQDVDVSAAADSIDAGAVMAWGSGQLSDWSGSDIPAMRLIFLDEGSGVLGQTGWFEMPLATWTEVDIPTPLPPLTRFVRMELQGTRVSGQDNDSYFDALSLRLGSEADCGGLPLVDQFGPVPDAKALEVYPNPGPGPVTVAWPRDFNPHLLRVVDSLGRKVEVLKEPGENGWRLTLGTGATASGTLHLLAVDRMGRVARGQWVVTE